MLQEETRDPRREAGHGCLREIPFPTQNLDRTCCLSLSGTSGQRWSCYHIKRQERGSEVSSSRCQRLARSWRSRGREDGLSCRRACCLLSSIEPYLTSRQDQSHDRNDGLAFAEEEGGSQASGGGWEARERDQSGCAVACEAAAGVAYLLLSCQLRLLLLRRRLSRTQVHALNEVH